MKDLPLDEYLKKELARRTERCLRLEQEKAELILAVAALRAELAAERAIRTQRRLLARPAPATRMGGE